VNTSLTPQRHNIGREFYSADKRGFTLADWHWQRNL